jgi:hypothetical protein
MNNYSDPMSDQVTISSAVDGQQPINTVAGLSSYPTRGPAPNVVLPVSLFGATFLIFSTLLLLSCLPSLFILVGRDLGQSHPAQDQQAAPHDSARSASLVFSMASLVFSTASLLTLAGYELLQAGDSNRYCEVSDVHAEKVTLIAMLIQPQPQHRVLVPLKASGAVQLQTEANRTIVYQKTLQVVPHDAIMLAVGAPISGSVGARSGADYPISANQARCTAKGVVGHVLASATGASRHLYPPRLNTQIKHVISPPLWGPVCQKV